MCNIVSCDVQYYCQSGGTSGVTCGKRAVVAKRVPQKRPIQRRIGGFRRFRKPVEGELQSQLAGVQDPGRVQCAFDVLHRATAGAEFALQEVVELDPNAVAVFHDAAHVLGQGEHLVNTGG